MVTRGSGLSSDLRDVIIKFYGKISEIVENTEKKLITQSQDPVGQLHLHLN